MLLLIFDQFEEYLVQHQDRHKEKEAFFQKIAEALGGDPLQGLEGDPLLRVLFVIKEEFLAALDPYVDLLPDMLRTRYRLECLRQDGAIEAVEKPVDKLRGDQKTARSYAPGVAEKLVQKLLASDASEQEAPVSSEYVEPGQLQVVCIKLWEIPEKGEKQITEEHLKKLDVNKALTSFYEESLKAAVAASGVPEVELRRWFNEGLITSAGTRGMVFRGQETTEGIPNAAIDILDKEKHIIRAEARASGSWYELTHDRLIEPIRKSNEEWLHSWDVKVAEDNLKKKYNRWLVIGFVGSLVLLVFAYWLHIYSEKDRVEGEIKRLQRKPAQVQLEQGERVAETIAAYLWEKRDPLPLYNPYCLDNVVLGPSLNRLIVNLKASRMLSPVPVEQVWLSLLSPKPREHRCGPSILPSLLSLLTPKKRNRLLSSGMTRNATRIKNKYSTSGRTLPRVCNHPGEFLSPGACS